MTTDINQDTVSWIAPDGNGSPIDTYYWESTDGKSGFTTNTSVTVTQEGSTSQAYRVRAENAVALSNWSPYSDEITTTPPFFPPFFPPYFPYFPSFQPSCSGCNCCAMAADGNGGFYMSCNWCYVPGTCFCDD